MINNVGSTDRAIRLAAGIVLLGFGLFCPFAHSLGAVVTGISIVVGLVLLGTGMGRFCPAYRLLGISTCRSGDSAPSQP
ncbi:MAG: DUF2892 domain-containing protein [Alphaproteobacteria bacterium]|nr:DUF2892 domain-containing protein [Alphaproteobacteria bacterium]